MGHAYAYTTLLLTSSYLPGTLALCQSLRNSGSIIPIVLLYSKGNVKPEIVQRLTDSGLFSQMLNVDNDIIVSRNRYELVNLLKRSELDKTLTKLNCWRLISYEKIIYLDSDTLVVRNIDHLFDLHIDSSQIYAAPDCGWPDCFNSGVFLFKPDLETFRQLKEFSETADSFDGSDQGLLNEFFNLSGPQNYHWSRLSFSYNCTLNTNYEYVPALIRFHNDIRIVHFIGSLKPWNNRISSYDSKLFKLDLYGTGVLKNFQQLWWDCYDSVVVGDINSVKLLELSGNLQPRPSLEPPKSESASQNLINQQKDHSQTESSPQKGGASEINFPTYYYKQADYQKPLEDQSAKGEAWRLDEPRFNFPTDTTDSIPPASEITSNSKTTTINFKSPAEADVTAHDYTQDYVKDHPIFPWEKEVSRSSATRVFYNSPAYKPPAYTISMYKEKKTLSSPSYTQNPDNSPKERFVGFDDGDELEHYLEAVEKLPSVQNEDEVEEDEARIENEEDERIATNPEMAKVEKDLDDDDLKDAILEENHQDQYLKDSEQREEANKQVDAVIEDLTDKVSAQLQIQ
ncbi:hypothetical protein FOA43_003103 [Brettanomyces nanus]|uniref:glycogenin glucosyltransferase n=1 Tax=Eeniella nana TaxID=13502 RepID=A0A875S4B3_EENNA|nr:uncharacterized protein FOA43_003103 [Brettanomyces nanus]QPG75743.1 hypothetical protein FOA43_003103 [Brettanomyces nanus]